MIGKTRPLTPEYEAEIRARVAADHGPYPGEIGDLMAAARQVGHGATDLMAHARWDVPALLAELDRVRGDRLRHRPCTPDRRETTDDGREVTVVTVKRYCPRGHLLGDATEAEVLAASRGVDLPRDHGCAECRDGVTP